MKRILYATIFLFCFNISHSIDINKIKNSYRHGDLFDMSEDGIWPEHQMYKRPIGTKFTYWRRANKDKSCIDQRKYQDEFRDLYKQKKKEALDTATPKTDVVNMVAARPWGVPCGDPNQYDMPWGSCMRPEQCAPEYRVYRGDYFCGRTTFVCCALKFYDYDPVGPLDASFGGSDYEVPLAEKLKHKAHSEKNKKSRYRDENRRLREEERKKRKKRMQKLIKRIVRDIERTFKDESKLRKNKTRQFKKFLKSLKRKYDKARLLVRDQHRDTLNRTDREGEERLKRIYEMNKQFIRKVTGWDDATTPRASTANVIESPDPGDDPRDDPRDDPGDDPRDNPRDDPGDNPRDDPGDDPRYDAGDDPGDEPRDNPRDDPGDNPRDDLGDDPRYDAGDDHGDEPRDNPRDDPGDNPRDDPGDDPIYDAGDDP